MRNLEQFKEEAKRHGICELLNDWDNARSKKQLMDIALSIRGIEYLAQAIAEDWGPSADYIVAEFEPFNDGRYIRNADGYTSAMFCLTERPDITVETTAALIIGFKGTVHVGRPCELYIVNSDCEIAGDTECRTYVFRFNSQIKCGPHIRLIDKED